MGLGLGGFGVATLTLLVNRTVSLVRSRALVKAIETLNSSFALQVFDVD